MEHWMIREQVEGQYDAHINSSGRRPASFGKFDYVAVFDPSVEMVEVASSPDADRVTIEHLPSLQKGVEWALDLFRERSEQVASLRIEIPRVYRHPSDPELLGSSHGALLITRLLDQHGQLVPTFPTAWLTATVVGIARQMQWSGNFSAMPVLADALEEAGCDDPNILAHCRGPSSHARGCWVVDLALGPE